jgi:AraC-like DNA-binding protein
MVFQYGSLRLIGADDCQLTERYDFTLEREQEYAFGYVLKGDIELVLVADGYPQRQIIESRQLFLIPEKSRIVICPRGPYPARLVFIRFQWEGDGSLFFPQGIDHSNKSIGGIRLPQTQSWITDFLMTRERGGASGYFQLQSHLYMLASVWIDHMQQVQSDNHLYQYVKHTRLHMLNHYDEQLDIEQLARSSGVSASRFYRIFKAHAGLSPNKFLTYLRLREALSLLSGSPATVSDVAHAVGYRDEYYFSRLFKKHLGISPSTYMARSRIKVANLSPVFQEDLTVLGIIPQFSLRRGWSKTPDLYLEHLQTKRPDLILTSPVPEEVYKRLTAIAPVEVIYWKRCTWKERLQQISRLFDLETVGEWWLRHYELKIKNRQAHIDEVLGNHPCLVVKVKQDHFQVLGPGFSRLASLFYDELKMKVPSFVRDLKEAKALSLSELAKIDGPHVIFVVPGTVSPTACSWLEKKWKELKGEDPERTCFIIRYHDELKYSARVFDRLAEDTLILIQDYGQRLKENPA